MSPVWWGLHDTLVPLDSTYGSPGPPKIKKKLITNFHQITSIFYMLLEDSFGVKSISKFCLWVLLTHVYWFRATGGYICGCGRPSNLVIIIYRLLPIYFCRLYKLTLFLLVHVLVFDNKNMLSVKYILSFRPNLSGHVEVPSWDNQGIELFYLFSYVAICGWRSSPDHWVTSGMIHN